MSKRTKAARRSSAEWASLIEACAQSGLSHTAFAEREGIHPGTFAWWASRLGAGARGRAPMPKATSARSVDAASFVPVRVLSGAATHGRTAHELARTSVARTAASGSVEVVLVNGRRVRCELEQVGDPRLGALLKLAEGAGVC